MELTAKQHAELEFWNKELHHYYREWMHGGIKELYGIHRPEPLFRYPGASEVQNALRLWTFADRHRYCKHLLIPSDYWAGLRGVEIGCGPLGLGRWFAETNIIGIDPLLPHYVKIGFPRIETKYYKAIPGVAERLDFANHSCDFAYSVNAIDHVDDFEAAVEELERVVDPIGEIRIEVHYHEATVTEPIVLNDERVKAAFKKFDMKKISELPSTAFYPAGTHPVTDRFALWSNKDFKWEGALNL